MSSDATRRWALLHRGMDKYVISEMTSEQVSEAFLDDVANAPESKRPKPALSYDPSKYTMILMVDDQLVYMVPNSSITPRDREILQELHGRSTPRNDLRMFHLLDRVQEWGGHVRLLEFRKVEQSIDQFVSIQSPIER
jgi:hypothetical protein